MVDADTQLMLDFCAGDKTAFRQLVRRNTRVIFNLAYRYLFNHADAEDVTQEVFMKVHGAGASYKPTAKFTTWVYRITANTCLNRLRSARARRTVSLDWATADDDEGAAPALPRTDAANPSARLEKEELEEKVRDAMGRLPESQRTVVMLRRFHELSYEEIAEVLETTVPAVKSLLARARRTLKSLLTRYL